MKNNEKNIFIEIKFLDLIEKIKLYKISPEWADLLQFSENQAHT